MTGASGGTQMYCPECKKIEACSAISTTKLRERSGQRWFRTQYDDMQWFRRARECQSCKFQFLTSEVHEAFLDELVELGDAFSDLKSNAESYIHSSKDAESSLRNLTEPLQVLRALKIYQST